MSDYNVFLRYPSLHRVCFRGRLSLLGMTAFLVAYRPAIAAPPAATAQPTAIKAAAEAQKPAAEAFYGVYLKGAKIGSVIIGRQDNPPTKAQPGGTVRTQSVLKMDLRVMGSNAQLTSTSVSLSDGKSGRPLTQFSQTEGAGRLTKTTATYTDKSVSYVTRVGANEKKGTLTLKQGEAFLFDSSSAAVFKPKVGTEIKGKVFVAETLSLSDATVKIVSREPIDISGQSVSAYKVVQSGSSSGTTISYLNDVGDLLRSDAPLGMQIRKEPKDIALAAPAVGDAVPDLVSIVAITPTGATIASPRTATAAKYTLSGVTRPLPASDSVQSAAPGAAEGTVTVTVTARPLPASGAERFTQQADVPAALRPYLASTVYVPAETETFRSLARQIIGSENDSARAAGKIAAWVSRTVKPDTGIVAIRSADDVLKDPRGVCRDYTTLFTAIARAAGLPTKQCVGVVFADGKFLYHAWPEVWVGAGDSTDLAAGWVALEPTFGAPFADATHIKLAEGEITDVARIAADVGSYQITVLEVR
ncbi:MAG: transglutaminase domain-containing protein [Armatimonadota bacterium]